MLGSSMSQFGEPEFAAFLLAFALRSLCVFFQWSWYAETLVATMGL
jgi:hypothetical protein